MEDTPRDRVRARLAVELADLELDEEDLEAALELTEQVRDAARAVAGQADANGAWPTLAVGEATHALAETAIDEEIEEDRSAGFGPDCKAGCSACCHIPVSATASDIAVLIAWLDDQKEEIRSDVIRRTYESLPRASGKEPRGVLPCPLLDLELGTCRAYEARPLACRGCLSDDARQCVPGKEILAFVAPQVIARSAATGVRLVLAERGEDGAYGDLIVGLASAFDAITAS